MHGVGVGAWHTATPESPEFVLRFVCASQDAYQQTHPVLFSDRAIYIVLYSMRTGASPADIRRHLMNVAIRCKDAPILLVGTHADVVHGGSGLSLAALKRRFPQVCVCMCPVGASVDLQRFS